jgi:PAS domain S-box-containing protein
VHVQAARRAGEQATLPQSLLQYVLRTHEKVILDDAAGQSQFAADPYVSAHQARSILCLPLINQAQLVGVLYLENNLAARVFLPQRTAVLTILASYAATSLDKGRLYRDLQERESKFRRLVDSNIIGVVVADRDGAILEANNAFLDMLGYSQDDISARQLRWQDLTPAEWLSANQRAWEQTRTHGRCEAFEKEYFRKDGSRVPVLVAGAAFDDARTKAISFVLDLSERKRAEAEHRAHVWFLESMDRINRAIQGTNDLEHMMSEVLEAALEIFACDRAWLLYPCDPHAPSWRAVYGAYTPAVSRRVRPADRAAGRCGGGWAFAAARAASGAVQFQPHSDLKVPAQVAERFAIRSQIAIAVHPKGDQPYLFGLHQCSGARLWTAQEERLFQEIGRRLADGLTSLLMFRSLRESERRLEEAQRIARVGWWERDMISLHTTVSAEACRIFGLGLAEGKSS